MSSAVPVLLAANQPDRPYLGGTGIAELRGGAASPEDHRPEDFVGSTTEIFAGGGVGLSRLPSGVLLRDAIEADPVGYLGEGHVQRFGPATEILVKILDTAERLFVHVHPDGGFAHRHLGLAHGKTEAWVVTGVAHPEATAHLGFRRAVSAEEVRRWVDDQDVAAMLDAMHAVPLRVGTTILVPAGVAHAIGAGVTLVEVQEPSDLSVLLEFAGFAGLGADDAFLGMDPDVALGCLDRSALASPDVLVSRVPEDPAVGLTRLLPSAADPFFRAEWVVAGEGGELDPGFSILVVLEGAGTLSGSSGPVAVERGSTVLIPHGAGAVALSGGFSGVRCRPPAA